MFVVRSGRGRWFLQAIMLAGLLAGCSAGSSTPPGKVEAPVAGTAANEVAPSVTVPPAVTTEPAPANPSIVKPLFVSSTQSEPAGQAFPTAPVLIYSGLDESGTRQVYAAGRDGQSPVPVIAQNGGTGWHSVADDGKWLLYVRDTANAGHRLCVIPVAAGQRQCFDYPGTVIHVQWRPVTHLLYVVVNEGTYVLNPETDSALSPTKVTKDKIPHFSPDGKWLISSMDPALLVYSLDQPGRVVSLGLGNLAAWLDPQTVLMVQGEHWLIQPVQERVQPEVLSQLRGLVVSTLSGSPDGRWIAGLVRQTDSHSDPESLFHPGPLQLQLYDRTRRVWVAATQGGSPRTLALSSEAALAGWSGDGRYVAIATWDGQILYYEPAAGTWSEPVALYPVGNALARWSQRGVWMALPIFQGPQRERQHMGIAVIDAASAKVLMTVVSEEPRLLWFAGPSN